VVDIERFPSRLSPGPKISMVASWEGVAPSKPCRSSDNEGVQNGHA
jgi:hypothetical protein